MAKPSQAKARRPRKASRSIYIRRGRTDQPASESLMVRAARLLHEARKTQKEVAKELTVSPATVSRLIEAAQQAGIIYVEIRPPHRLDLETKLKECLKVKGIHNVVVVPRGVNSDGKNTQNLGPAGATALLQAMEEVGKSTVTVAIACGETLRAVLDEFIQLVRRSDPVPTKTLEALEFYPTTLHSGYHLSAIHPATLVSSLSMVTFGAFKIDAYATSLPEGFYDLPADERSDYRRRWRVDELVDRAAQADVFVLGIGTTDSESYRDIVATLKIEDWEKEKGKFVAEVAYTPIDAEGMVAERVAEKAVGVSLDRLRNAARMKGKHVIGVAGGIAKDRAIEAAIKAGAFNYLVTDEAVAEYLLGVFV